MVDCDKVIATLPDNGDETGFLYNPNSPNLLLFHDGMFALGGTDVAERK